MSRPIPADALRYEAAPDVSGWTMVQLDARHRAANRWLDLPGAHHWPDQKATEEAYLRACWEEMQRRRAASARKAAA